MVEALRHLVLRSARQLAMVAQEDKHGVLIPGLRFGLLEEETQGVIGILHYLLGLLIGVGVEPLGYDVGRVVAYAEQRGHEGFLLPCHPPQRVAV